MTAAFDHLSFPVGGDYSDDTIFEFGPEYGNNFTTVNQFASTGGQTVSPQELLMSAPGSGHIGLLDTPESELLESPALESSVYNTTPLEDGSLDATLNFDELKRLPPLITHTDQFTHAPINDGSHMDFSPSGTYTGLASSNVPSPMVRQKSSPGRPPISGNIHTRKHSLNSGIVKASKSRKDLPEITINSDDDKETAKRKKNTAAARKSRQRKAEDLEYLQSENSRLRALVESLGGDPD